MSLGRGCWGYHRWIEGTFRQEHDIVEELEGLWCRLQQSYQGGVGLAVRHVPHELDDLKRGCRVQASRNLILYDLILSSPQKH